MMKKRDEQDSRTGTPSLNRRDTAETPRGAQSAEDFAQHLAAMFRAELGEEEQAEAALIWEPVAAPSPRREDRPEKAAEDLRQAVADFLSDETEDTPQEARREKSRRAPAGKRTEPRRRERTEPPAGKRAEPPRRKERAEAPAEKQAAPSPAPEQREAGQKPEAEPAPAQERLVFFEPKQKKNSFFDILPEAEPAAPKLPEEAPAEPEAARTESPAPQTEDSRASSRSKRSSRHRRARSDGQTPPARQTAAPERQAAEQTPPAEEELILPGLDDVPLVSPKADLSLEDIFGSLEELYTPLGLKTAPPEADTAAVLNAAVLTPRMQAQEAAPTAEEELVLPAFDDIPFDPPKPDPSLEELFGFPKELFAPAEQEAAPQEAEADEPEPTAPQEAEADGAARQQPQPEAGQTAQTAPAGKRRGWLRSRLERRAQREAAPQPAPAAEQAPAPAQAETAEPAPPTPAEAGSTEPAQEEYDAILAAMELEIPGLAALLRETEAEAAPAPQTEAEDVPAVETEAVPAVEAEAVPAVETEAVPVVEAEAVPAVETEAVPAVEAEAEELPTAVALAETKPLPELWDPLSIFEEAAEDAPPPLTPLSRNTTGPLPTLEELFGPTPDRPAPQPAPVRPPRRERKRSWLRELMTGDPAEGKLPELTERTEDVPPTEQTEQAAQPAPTAQPELTEEEKHPDGSIAEQATPAPDPEAETPPPAQAAASPQENDEAADWDPLTLFGEGPAEEALPTWAEYLNRQRGKAPEAEPEPVSEEPETVPMDLSGVPEAPAQEAPRRRRRAHDAPRGGDALTLEDFLTAAVPMEEAAPPKRERSAAPRHGKTREQSLTVGLTGAETISTARENPAGLILTWADRDERAQAPASEPPKSPEKTPAPAKAAEPTPSADVRTTASAAASSPARSEPTAQSHFAAARSRRPARREEAVLPPEEKTVLRPEEAYRVYARPLDEVGSRLVLTGLFTLLSLFFTLYLTRQWSFLPGIFSGGTTVYLLLALLGLMVLVNRKLYLQQWRDEMGLRPGLLLGVATLFTALDCFPAAKELRPPFTVVVGALLMIELWGRYDRGLALITTVKVLRGEQLSAGVSEVQDITKGSRGLIRTKPDVERFMEKLETRDLTDRVLRVYTPVALGLGIVLTLLISLGLKRPPLWTGALVFLGSVPVTGLLAFPRLFCLLAKRLAEAKAALCGYHGAEAFGGEHSILIGDDDIFPEGSLTLNGYKVYNGNPDRMIAYAAAAFRSSGSALDPVFEELLVTHNGRHYSVDNFRFYDSGGIGASIQQDVVLLGSLDFMRRMGVHMDKGARVKQAVYMSLNGELAAVFAVRYTPPENLRKGLASIAGNRHFKGILVTRTFLGTPFFLKSKFGIPTGAFHYPSTKERIRLSEAEMKRSGAQGAILAKDSFSGFAQAAAGGRMLRSATLGAALLTVLGGLASLGLMGILAALPAYETATALNLLLYTAAWLAPTLLLTAWGRHF